MNYPNEHTPLFYQVYLDFRAKIVMGDWPVGTQVPTVDQLYVECGVSRSTIRKAMELLERDGFIFRRRGMGTFVQDLSFRLEKLEEVTRFVDDNWETKILKSDFIDPPVRVVNIFSLQKPEKVLHVQRLQIIDGIEYMFANIFFAPEIGERIKVADLTRMHVPEVMRSCLGIKMKSITRVIRPWIADRELSTNLTVSLGTPVLKFDFTGYDKAGRVLYLTELVSKVSGLYLEVQIEDS